MKVAAIQAEPAWLDLQGGVEKTIKLIKEASGQGAELIGFPVRRPWISFGDCQRCRSRAFGSSAAQQEVFIPGFPHTLFTNPPSTDFILSYQRNSMSLDSPEYKKIRQAVREAGVWVVLGFSEREGSSLYMSQVCFDVCKDSRLKVLTPPRRPRRASSVPLATLLFTVARSSQPTLSVTFGEMLRVRSAVACFASLDALNRSLTWRDFVAADSMRTSIKTEKGIVVGGLQCWYVLLLSQAGSRFADCNCSTDSTA